MVYKRFPIRSMRTAAVMFVSSVWHGVHPGYYLGLCRYFGLVKPWHPLSVPLCLTVEDFWRRKVRSKLGERAQRWYDWGAWFVRMRWFDYLGMAFLLLRSVVQLLSCGQVCVQDRRHLGVLELCLLHRPPLSPTPGFARRGGRQAAAQT